MYEISSPEKTTTELKRPADARPRPAAAHRPKADHTQPRNRESLSRTDGDNFVSNRAAGKVTRQTSNAAQEAASAAERLNTQVEDALAAVNMPSGGAPDELEASADRIERAARDLSVALRDLASRQRSREET